MDRLPPHESLPLWQVDAFTDRGYSGNPAAVCLLPRAWQVDDSWMQRLATEMNLSETAFAQRSEQAWNLRWMTPKTEVELCGHATLATAHVLWEADYLAADEPACFDTRSGRLTCTRNSTGTIEMDFPAKALEPAPTPAELLPALGLASARFVGRNAFDYFLEITDEAQLAALEPDHARLRSLPVRGVIVTARASAASDYDFVSRFFAPGAGVDEDPVTGSAHCALAPYWSGLLGRDQLVGYQASSRGGLVQTRVVGERVLLGGEAVTVLCGEIATAALP